MGGRCEHGLRWCDADGCDSDSGNLLLHHRAIEALAGIGWDEVRVVDHAGAIGDGSNRFPINEITGDLELHYARTGGQVQVYGPALEHLDVVDPNVLRIENEDIAVLILNREDVDVEVDEFARNRIIAKGDRSGALLAIDGTGAKGITWPTANPS